MKTMTSTAIAFLFLPTIALATSASYAVAAGATAGASTGATGGASAGATGGVGAGTSGISVSAPARALAVGGTLLSHCSRYRILNGRSYCYAVVGQRRVMVDSHTHRIVRILP
jgi:hypothetical protein